MSGGSYNYKFLKIIELADEIETCEYDNNEEEYIKHQETRDRFAKVLKEIGGHCKTIEWIDSFDSSPEKYKDIEKWLDNHNF